MLFYNEFILYGIEISSVLSIILTKQQYDDVRWGLMKHNGQRAKAMMRLDLHEESSRNVINDDSMSYYERMIKEAAMILGAILIIKIVGFIINHTHMKKYRYFS